MNSDEIERLALVDLDIDALEQRLEMAALLHPMLWSCGTHTTTCNGNVVITPILM